jgi:hypothetical protein
MAVDMREFKKHFGIPETVRNRSAINAAIRKYMPGGDQVLTVIERLIRMQHGRATPDPALQDMLDNLSAARDIMAEAMIAGFLASHAPDPAPMKKKTGPPLAEDRIDWSAVDWEMANATLARELGVSPQAVAKQRGKRT